MPDAQDDTPSAEMRSSKVRSSKIPGFMGLATASRSAPGGRWLWRLGAGLACALLFVTVSTVSTDRRVVGAARPDLGSVELVFGKGPSGVKGWIATFNVDVPVDRAWAVLSDCKRFPEVLQGVAKCTLLREEGKVRIHRMDLTHPKGAYMETRTVYDVAHHRTEWQMTSGSFQAGEGGVSLVPHPRHPGWTRVTYRYHLAISPLLPESFEVPRVRRMVRRMAHEIQRFFSGQPARPRRGHATGGS